LVSFCFLSSGSSSSDGSVVGGSSGVRADCADCCARFFPAPSAAAAASVRNINEAASQEEEAQVD